MTIYAYNYIYTYYVYAYIHIYIYVCYAYIYISVAVVAQSQFRFRLLDTNYLGMGKCPVRLDPKNSKEYKELLPFQEWFNKNRNNPIVRRLLEVAYRNWKKLVYINNKVVKKEPRFRSCRSSSVAHLGGSGTEASSVIVID